MNVRFLTLSLFALVAACSSSSSPSSNNGVTKTSAVVPKTVAGVCQKLDSMACAQPNCTEKLTQAQTNCNGPTDVFQSLLDCMSLATLECQGDPAKPSTPECSAQLQRAEQCSTFPTIPTSDAGADTSTPLPEGQCATSADCTAWDCLCADGVFETIAECKNKKCTEYSLLCKSGDPAFETACKEHGGTT